MFVFKTQNAAFIVCHSSFGIFFILSNRGGKNTSRPTKLASTVFQNLVANNFCYEASLNKFRESALQVLTEKAEHPMKFKP